MASPIQYYVRGVGNKSISDLDPVFLHNILARARTNEGFFNRLGNERRDAMLDELRRRPAASAKHQLRIQDLVREYENCPFPHWGTAVGVPKPTAPTPALAPDPLAELPSFF